MKPEEIRKLEAYFKRNLNKEIVVKARPRKDESAEVYLADEFLGVIFRDDEDGESRHLHAKLAVDGRLLLLTITDGVDAPRDWSERVARSAFHPPPGE